MPRETISITTPVGRIEAYVYIPKQTRQKLPVVILGCGVGAVKAAGLQAFDQAFCDEGYAAIAFDYLTFGGSEGTPRHVVIVWNQYRDFQNVVSWARQDPRFDSSRIVVWGTSFAGMHVTQLLSEDPNIAAGIAQCPCVDAALASRMKPFSSTVRLTFWAICDGIGSSFGANPIYLQAADTRNGRNLSLMAGQDVVEGWELLHKYISDNEGGEPFYNKIAARSLLSFPISRPATAAHLIVAPYLIVVPEHDSVAPKEVAEHVAKVAKHGSS